MRPPEFEVQGEHVILDPKNLDFDERTLSHYLIKEGGHYNYFGSMFAYAEYEQSQAEHHHECCYSAALKMYKDEGATEKKAEAQAKIDPKVIAAKEVVNQKKLHTALLKHHLKAWDKTHENAQSVGHMLRREMATLLSTGIPEPSGASTYRNRRETAETPSHIEELMQLVRKKEEGVEDDVSSED